MRRAMITASILAAVSSVCLPTQNVLADAAATQPAARAEAAVPVTTVMLFSSGVGYFEHTGSVDGNGSTELRFKTQQINDILKSLILQDSGGKVTTVSYASQDPIEKTLGSFQINIASNPSLGDLLEQIRGARIKVTIDAEEIDGTILGLEQREEPGKADKPVQRWFMNVISGATIRQVELDHVSRLELEDSTLQQELTQALQVLATSRDQDKKSVTIHFEGNGHRLVRIGYVVETPIWKTSYRLVLGNEDKKLGDKQPRDSLQGWAIVENQTDNDWSNINLTLVSGRPISFIEDLYQPRYIARVVLQPSVWGNLVPQTYEAGQSVQLTTVNGSTGNGINVAGQAAQFGFASNTATPNGAVAADRLHSIQEAEEVSAPAQPMDPIASISAMASAGQLGELFQYTIDHVSLPRQQSAMLPIITDPLKVERLSIFNAAVLRSHPLNGARITNTTGKHLLGGPITVLEAGAYAGDANIDNVPPGQNRLISFGVDLDVTVNPISKPMPTSITSASIVKGLLHLQHKLVSAEDYEISNKGSKAKTVLIEHVRQADWQLVNTDKPVETTPTQYRFAVAADSGKTKMFHVEQSTITAEQMEVGSFDDQTMISYINNKHIPDSVRDALAKAAKLKAAVVDTQRQIERHEHQLDAITKEQNRIRDNLRTVDRQSEYYNRLLTKLNEQESQIEKLQSQRDDLNQTLQKQQSDLDDYLANLTVQ